MFDKISSRDATAGSDRALFDYARRGLVHQALGRFVDMYRCHGGRIGAAVLSCVLNVCGSVPDRALGEQLHGLCVSCGHDRGDVSVGTSLVDMYMKFRSVEDGRKAFEGMPERNVVTWTSLLTGYMQAGAHSDVTALFFRMRSEGVWPNSFTFASVLSVLARQGTADLGRRLHAQSVKFGCRSTVFVCNSLINMYAKCGLIEEAKAVFCGMETRDLVSWNTLMAGLLLNRRELEALQLFLDSRSSIAKLTQSTYSTVIKLCAHLKQLGLARQLHTSVLKHGFHSDGHVMTALMDAYSKCGEFDNALNIFMLMPGSQNVVSWTAMINGCIQNGDMPLAAALFSRMREDGVAPNEFTYSTMLTASVASLAPQIHAQVIKTNYQCSPIVGTALLHYYSKLCNTEQTLSIFEMIDQKDDAICVSSTLICMYARKGSIDSAQSVFERQTDRDLVSWNSMISGYAQHGYSQKALDIFRQMEAEGIEMDGVTFLAVIMGCTHTGLVEEGRQYFDSMTRDYGISPTMEHYACMVDLYSRAGKLDETMSLIRGMPFPASPMVWRKLLGACRVHKNVELGKLAAEKLLSFEPLDSATYVLLSNIYSAAGKWKEKDEVRKLMDTKKVKKETGCSWIQIKNKVHSFIASDKSHPLSEQIYAKLKAITSRLKKEGYCPDTSFVLHEMAEEQKEAMLAMHSERLALAFGLITTPPGTPLQIVKNLRVCGDCHTVMKMVSAIEDRKIIMRDCSRFHHFSSGICSCGDFW
ncbi:hypothetical protein HU200_024359 [Digitaria exilis]|uniref:DYW domain-containing protein n=1 Tax=Digitaria exilis TaxID=1010633 RepID=A0A835CAC6_9POAL|nr:hypothetical protein HU200_024359 [Digitaria exilis]